jgi:Arc/MetJ-type ribon-helix-helix transcriptional regulator
MNVPVKKSRKTAVVSGRVSISLANRLDWLVRNHGEVESRAEAVKAAIIPWIEAREKECAIQGLSPPTA